MSISAKVIRYCLLFREASWTVADASFVLIIPPQEIMWFGWRDLEVVEFTNCFMAPTAFIEVKPFCF